MKIPSQEKTPDPENDPENGGDLDRLFRAVISRSIQNRGLALGVAVAILLLGVWSALRLPMDVTPDISNIQVQILTPVPSLAPEAAETSVTRPIELEMFGIPGLEQVRSITRFGISQVSLIFSEETNLYRARQMVSERLPQAVQRIPPGMIPALAPPSTGLGEIFTYALAYKKGCEPRDETDESRLRKLKTAQDFIVKPALRAVKGIADISSQGGFDRQLVVMGDPKKMARVGVDFTDLANALERNSAIGGGALVDRAARQVVLSSLARAQTVEEIQAITVKLSWGAAPVLMKDVATVAIGSSVRLGAATVNGEEAMLGTALMVNGENARAVAVAFGKAIQELRLPAGMEIRPLYNRAELVGNVIGTVRGNLQTAALLVAAVLVLFLGNWRAALIVASILILSFCLGVTGMAALGVAGSLLSLGAIDFGVIVDDTIVMVENVSRRLAGLAADTGPAARLETIWDACAQVRKPMFAGMLIIILAYFPVLGLTGVEGRLFRPLAQSVILMLASSLILTLFFVPAFCAFGFGSSPKTSPPRFMRNLEECYVRVFAVCRRHRIGLLAGMIGLAGLSAWLFAHLGADFMPNLDEGWLVVEVQRDPGASLPASVEMERANERAILAEVPEVKELFSKIGMSSIATDPQGAYQNDLYIRFKPKAEWRKIQGRSISKAALSELIKAVIARAVPGQELSLNQPVAVRFDELLEGVRADVAIKVFGPDLDDLDAVSEKIAGVVRQTPGTLDVMIDRTGRTDTLEFEPNRAAMQRYMAWADQINASISNAFQGRTVGRIDEGDQFYPLVLRLSDQDRLDESALNQLPLRSTEGSLLLHLDMLGRWKKVQRVAAITHENGERREAILLRSNAADQEGFVKRIAVDIENKVTLPDGCRIELAGSFKNLQEGRSRLAILGAVALVLSLLLVHLALGRWSQVCLVSLGIPFSMIGGVLGLWMRGLPLTLPAAVGFVTLSGLSILNGLVLVTYFNQLRAQGVAAGVAVLASARTRLRPVLMTALVASVGFLPMAISVGQGAEIQRPFATVVIFGIFSATLLTLLITPILLDCLYCEKLTAQSGPRPKRRWKRE